MLEEIPYYRLEEAMPDGVRRLLGALPVLKPVIPDPGVRFQLVHEDDVASAFAAAVRGLGEPGAYNLAGNGTLTMADVAAALGWYAVPVPRPLVDATAEIATRLPLMPEQVAWIHSLKKPVLMKTTRAKQQLRWRPKHTAKATLKQMADAQRAARYSAA
jgi:UDP-glucose 4-epimerase